MSLTGYSHGSIIRWAKHNFAVDFEQLPGARDVTVQQHKVPGHSKNGCLKGLVIGTSKNEKGEELDILAWLEGSRMVVGYVTVVGNRLQDVRFDSAESVIHGAEKFRAPFCWVLGGGDETAFGKLEALVRYFFLLKGSMHAVKDNFEDFAIHFSGACRDVGAAKGVAWTEPESTVRVNSLGGSNNAKAPGISSTPTPLYDFEVFVHSLDAPSNGSPSTYQSSVDLIGKRNGWATDPANVSKATSADPRDPRSNEPSRKDYETET